MRKFRAKCYFKNDWWIGYYVYSTKENKHFIAQDANEDMYGFVSFAHFAHINPETLGQFTGLNDKNGNPIYEGDILKINLPLGGFWGNVKKEKIGQVIYESDFAGFIIQWEYSKNQHHENLGCDIAFDSEILGNIHEHKKLLP